MIGKNKMRLFAGLLVAAAVIALLFIAGGRAFRTEVSVAATERGTAVHAVPGVVRIAAARTVELRTEAGGRVVEGYSEVGGHVEEGEILLRLDDVELSRAIDRVRLDLEAEEALREVGSLLRYDLEEAREELERKEESHEKGEFSRRELDLQRRRIARLVDEIALEEIRERRRVETLKSELARLEEELKKTEVTAPVSGHVVEILAYPGDLVTPRGTVARIISDERTVEATLSEENFAGVKSGQPATVRLLSYGSRLFPARVDQVLPAADPETQRYKVLLEVEMPEELMAPGLTGEVSIVLGERKDALIIPRRALAGGSVFVVRDGAVESQRVKTGFVSLTRVEILAGLEEGDFVAVENLDRLRDGDRVRLKRAL